MEMEVGLKSYVGKLRKMQSHLALELGDGLSSDPCIRVQFNVIEFVMQATF